MQYEVLAAHSSFPEDFQPCFSITIHGGDSTNFVDEIVELLNYSECRDCVFKVTNPPANNKEQNGHIAQQSNGGAKPTC